jgi:hypothetical protein
MAYFLFIKFFFGTNEEFHCEEVKIHRRVLRGPLEGTGDPKPDETRLD